MPHRNILLPDSRWVTVFSVFSARSVQPKDPAGRSHPQVFLWFGSASLPEHPSFDANAGQPDVEIDLITWLNQRIRMALCRNIQDR